MKVELRCGNGILFGYLLDGIIEVKCRSNRCGAVPGAIVLHGFDMHTGKLVRTMRFRDPKAPSTEGGLNGSEHDPASIRVA
jgi:hypothetical protein